MIFDMLKYILDIISITELRRIEGIIGGK